MKRAVKKKVFAITAVLLGLIIGLIFLEFAIRIAIPQTMNIYTYDSDYVFAFRPHASINYKSVDFEQPVTFNSQGFRDYEYDYFNKPEDTYRILMLGDSFTAGLEVEFENTFVKIVEKQLQKENPKIEVLNAGTNGWSTEQELLFLEKRGIKYNPDLVVLSYYVGNDQIDNVQRPLFNYENNQLSINQNRPPSLSYPRSIYYFLSSNFHTFNCVMFKCWKEKVKFGVPPEFDYSKAFIPFISIEDSDEVKYAWNKNHALLERMMDKLERHNVKKMIVIIPDLIQEKPELRKKHDLDDTKLRLDAPQQQIKNIASKRDAPVIDLLPAFQYNANVSLHFDHDVHWTVRGHALAAQQIAPEISNFINEN